MNCEQVQDGDLLERYAANGLDEATRDRVEAHYFECAACLERLQLARAVREEFHRPPRWSGRPGTATAYAALAASLLLVAAGGSWIVMLQRQNRDLEARLARAAPPPRLEQQAQQIAALRARVDALSQPELNAPIVDLEPDDHVRRGNAPAATVEIAGDVRQITFVLTAGEALGAPPYAVSIVDGAGRVVWDAPGLRRSRFGTFTLAVPASLLPTGKVAIRLRSAAGGPSARVQEYDLRVVRR